MPAKKKIGNNKKTGGKFKWRLRLRSLACSIGWIGVKMEKSRKKYSLERKAQARAQRESWSRSLANNMVAPVESTRVFSRTALTACV